MTTACSQGASTPGSDGDGTFDSTTGGLIAHLKTIPDDVRCIEIQTSDYRRPFVQVDVVPGNEATIRIQPLQPGYVSFWGVAYRAQCGFIYGEGGTYANQSWVADYASAYVNSGAATPVTLTFRRLGSADVSVDFADSTCDGGVYPFDGGYTPCPPADNPPPPPSADGGW